MLCGSLTGRSEPDPNTFLCWLVLTNTFENGGVRDWAIRSLTLFSAQQIPILYPFLSHVVSRHLIDS